MDGFLNIYKEKGQTSYDVIRILKKLLGIRQIGHAGNLDPLGEGVLVIGIGKATRFLEFLIESKKEYRVKIKFGILTDTLDKDGKVIAERPVPTLDKAGILEVLNAFTGEVEQVPPSFSAIKYNGKRLYKYAREGIYLVPKPRKVKISRIDLETIGQDYIEIVVECSAGTYMRALARDIGEKLGTYGFVEELVRLKVGNFTVENAVKIDTKKRIIDSIIPIPCGLPLKSSVMISSNGATYFLNGNKVPRKLIVRTSPDTRTFTLVKVMDQENNFLGVGFLTWEGLEPKKVLVPSP